MSSQTFAQKMAQADTKAIELTMDKIIARLMELDSSNSYLQKIHQTAQSYDANPGMFNKAVREFVEEYRIGINTFVLDNILSSKNVGKFLTKLGYTLPAERD